MDKPRTVLGQVELTTGQNKLVNGQVDPERTLATGSLGVYVLKGRTARQLLHPDAAWTVIPWSQVRMLHLDL